MDVVEPARDKGGVRGAFALTNMEREGEPMIAKRDNEADHSSKKF
jgi:hypothetical protein